MTTKIRVLDETTINQMKAGEVIENPASVVKELVENSLDAGAKKITIEIVAGGRQLIRVSDDGSGMSKEDARLSFEKHATSKLSTIEDVHQIDTMGFRGEAIPSIAACSKVTLTTFDGTVGSRLLVEGGLLKSQSSVVAEKGTTFEVKSLFYNVPVRKKFQRSPTANSQEIHKMVNALALGNPEISFTLIRDGKRVFDLVPDSLRTRIDALLGEEFAENLLPVEKSGDISIQGFIGKPTSNKPNRTGQYLFFNRRRIFSPLVSRTIQDGYGPTLPHARHPLFVLHISLPGKLIDPNVHPQKKEVRLCEESALKSALFDAVDTALRKTEKPISFTPPERFFSPSLPRESVPMRISEEKEPYEWTFKSESLATVLCTLPGYAILQEKGELVMLDLRRSHARILYETLEKKDPPKTQALLIPETVQFSPSEWEELFPNFEMIQTLGVEIEQFGKQSAIIQALPPLRETGNLKEWLLSLSQETNRAEDKKAALAYATAVTKKRKLSNEEVSLLYQQLLECNHPAFCPKGKKIWVTLTPDLIGGLFK